MCVSWLLPANVSLSATPKPCLVQLCRLEVGVCYIHLLDVGHHTALARIRTHLDGHHRHAARERANGKVHHGVLGPVLWRNAVDEVGAGESADGEVDQEGCG